jgi:hypothetical protein
MSAYKSKARKLRDALVTVIAGIQYDTGSGPSQAFQLVTGDPSAAFNQEPYALIYPAPINSTKGATGQQDRNVTFQIIVLLEMENEARTQSQTYNYMYDLTELVLDSLDSGDFHDVLNTADPTLGTWLMDASRGTFVPATVPSGTVLLCTIDVAISYSIDL